MERGERAAHPDPGAAHDPVEAAAGGAVTSGQRGQVPPIAAAGGGARVATASELAYDRGSGGGPGPDLASGTPVSWARRLRTQAESLEQHLRDQLELRRDHAAVASVVDAVSALSRVLVGGSRRGAGGAPAPRSFEQLHAEVRAVVDELRRLEASLATAPSGARDLVPLGRRLAAAWGETVAQDDRQVASADGVVTGLRAVIATCMFVETTIGTAGGAAVASALGGSALLGAGVGAGTTAAAFRLATDATSAVVGADGQPVAWGALVANAGREGVSALAGVLIGGALAPMLVRAIGARVVPLLDAAGARAIARAIGAAELSEGAFAQLGRKLVVDVLTGAASTPFLVALDLALHGRGDVLTSPSQLVHVVTDALIHGGIIQIMLSVALHGYAGVAGRPPGATGERTPAPPPAKPAAARAPGSQPQPAAPPAPAPAPAPATAAAPAAAVLGEHAPLGPAPGPHAPIRASAPVPVGATRVQVHVAGQPELGPLTNIVVAEELAIATTELSTAFRAGTIRHLSRKGDTVVPDAAWDGLHFIEPDPAQRATLAETAAKFIQHARAELAQRGGAPLFTVNEALDSFRMTAEGRVVWAEPLRPVSSLPPEAARALVDRVAGAGEIAGIHQRATAAGYATRPEVVTAEGASRWRLAIDDAPGEVGDMVRALRDRPAVGPLPQPGGPARAGGAGTADTGVFVDPIALRAHEAGGLAMLAQNEIVIGESALFGRRDTLVHEAGHTTSHHRARAGDTSPVTTYRQTSVPAEHAGQYPIGIYGKGFIFDELTRHTKDVLVALRSADDAAQITQRLLARGELAAAQKSQARATALQADADSRGGLARALAEAITDALDRARAGIMVLRGPDGRPLSAEMLAAIDREHERQRLVLVSGRDRVPRSAAELDRTIAREYGLAAPAGEAGYHGPQLSALGADGAVTGTSRVGDPTRRELDALALRFTGDDAAARAAQARATATGPELGPAIESLTAGVLDNSARVRFGPAETIVENDRFRLALPGAVAPADVLGYLGALRAWARADGKRSLGDHELGALSRAVGTGALDGPRAAAARRVG